MRRRSYAYHLRAISCTWDTRCDMQAKKKQINPLTPNDPYSGRTAPLTSKVAFYIFIQQI